MSHGGDSWETPRAVRKEVETEVVSNVAKWLRWREVDEDIVRALLSSKWLEELRVAAAHDRVLAAKAELEAAEAALGESRW